MASQPQALSSSLTPDTNSSSLVSFNVAAQAPLKLTSANYLSWRLQFTTLLTGYGLLGHVDGSHPCPPSTIVNNGVSSPNSAHSLWVRQDQLILNALIASLSPTLIPFIATASTGQTAWTTLSLTFGKPTRGRITQLKTQLHQVTKGTKSVTEFLHLVKLKIDELALMNATVDPEDITIKILQGLDDDYKELANVIQARETPITFEELHEKLFTWEAQLAVDKPSPLPLPASANVTAKTPAFNRSTPRSPPLQTSGSSPPFTPWSPRPNIFVPRPPRPYLGHCQLCDQ